MDSTTLITACVVSVIFWIVGLYVAKSIFGFDKMIKQLNNQNEQLSILRRYVGRIAEAKGISKSELDSIKELAKTEYRFE